MAWLNKDHNPLKVSAQQDPQGKRGPKGQEGPLGNPDQKGKPGIPDDR